jgi:sulfhydrogenase subunit delta
MKKMKIGLFSLTCDEGCMVTFLEILNTKYFEWKDIVEVKYSKLLKTDNKLSGIDVAFVEGAVSTAEEEAFAKKIRKNSKFVVALGSCAATGSPSNFRNFFDEKTMEVIGKHMEKFGYMEKVSPLTEIIKVDDAVPGCPMIEENFVKIFEKYLHKFGVL